MVTGRGSGGQGRGAGGQGDDPGRGRVPPQVHHPGGSEAGEGCTQVWMDHRRLCESVAFLSGPYCIFCDPCFILAAPIAFLAAPIAFLVAPIAFLVAPIAF